MTDLTLERTDVDNTGAMADLSNDRILIKRPGKYLAMAHIMWGGFGAASTRVIGQITDSNTSTAITAHEMNVYTNTTFPSCQPYALVDMLTTSTIKIQGYQASGSSQSAYGTASGDTTQLLLIEQPSW
jgi:hypothetical protein